MIMIKKKKKETRPRKYRSLALFPQANYEAMHAQPSFISDKNNTQIENHSTHLEKHGETKGS